MSKRIYTHCLKNHREQSGHWGWGKKKKKGKSLKKDRDSHKTTRYSTEVSQQYSVRVKMYKICKHYVQNKFDRMKK